MDSFYQKVFKGLFDLKLELCQRPDGNLPCTYCINCERIEDLISDLDIEPRINEERSKDV